MFSEGFYTKLASLYGDNFLGYHVDVPKELMEQADMEDRLARANRWGDRHHVTLVRDREMKRLGEKAREAFTHLTTADMALKPQARQFQGRGRTYTIADVDWPSAQAAREQLGLKPAMLHVTLGVKMPKEEKTAMWGGFLDELWKHAAPDKTSFWDHVDKDGKGGCWNWTGATNDLGYGMYRTGDRVELAQKVSLRLTRGASRDGDEVIAHKCDNRRCVNPSHLELKSQGDNLQEMHDKGRHPKNR